MLILVHNYNKCPSIIELCQDGVDQRDYFYFMALGYFKLEVMTPY